MTIAPNGKWTWFAGAVALSVCAYIFYRNTLCVLYGSYDTGWIIRTGQQILQNGLPHETLFSWSVSDRPYVAYQWLYAVASAGLFQAGSLWVVGLVTCIMAGLLLLLLLPRLWMKQGLPAWAPYTVLALVQTPHWFNARPQLCSYFLLLAVIAILEKYRRNTGTKWIFTLPLLMVLWVNLHSFWAIGLVAVAVYLAKDFTPRLAGCAAACLAAVAVNPYGLRLPLYLATFIDGSQYSNIYELRPWWNSAEYWWTLLYVPLVAAAFWKHRQVVPFQAFVLAAITLLAALFMRRFEPIFVLVTWTFLGKALAQNVTAQAPALRIHLPAAIATAVFAWYSQFPTLPSAWMVYTEDTYPLLKIVQEHTSKDERIFQTPVIGSWMLAMNQDKVFADSRFDAYPKKFLLEVDHCLEAKPNTLETFDRLHVDHIVVRDDMPLAHLLMSTAHWSLALDDGMVSWWVRTQDRERVMSRLQGTTLPPHIEKATQELLAVRSRLSL